jgi:hypothetical protein
MSLTLNDDPFYQNAEFITFLFHELGREEDENIIYWIWKDSYMLENMENLIEKFENSKSQKA